MIDMRAFGRTQSQWIQKAYDAHRCGNEAAFEEACAQVTYKGETVKQVVADIRLAIEDYPAWCGTRGLWMDEETILRHYDDTQSGLAVIRSYEIEGRIQALPNPSVCSMASDIRP